MPVGYRNSSTTGNAANVTSRAPAVPAGAAAGDIVVVFLDRWNGSSTRAAVTGIPTGFTLKATYPSGPVGAEIGVWWKRLTGSDAGTYSFTWTGSMWTTAHAIAITGAVATGDPISGINAFAGTAGTYGSISVTSTGQPALLWETYNDTGGAHTPATSFTEVIDNDCASCAYRLPGTTGSHTASGGSVATSSAAAAVLLAIEPAAAAGPEPGRFLLA